MEVCGNPFVLKARKGAAANVEKKPSPIQCMEMRLPPCPQAACTFGHTIRHKFPQNSESIVWQNIQTFLNIPDTLCTDFSSLLARNYFLL